MRPILPKGHERPLTLLKCNRDGDLLFSCTKDHSPNVWYSHNGERLGTYRGHNGAVWCCDVSRHTERLITGSADKTVKLSDVETGTQLHNFAFESPALVVDFSEGIKFAVITTDPFIETPSEIHVKRIEKDHSKQSIDFVVVIKGPQGRINRAVRGPLNKTIISAGEDCTVRMWDAESGKLIKESDPETGHQKVISSLAVSADGSHFITGSHFELEATPPVETPPPKLPGKSNLKRHSMFGSSPPSKQSSGPPPLSHRLSDCVDTLLTNNTISNDVQSADGPKSSSGNGPDNGVVLEADLEEYKRKDSRVTWTDSHGKNLAEVWEFEPSDTSDSGEESDGKSSQACTCVIQ